MRELNRTLARTRVMEHKLMAARRGIMRNFAATAVGLGLMLILAACGDQQETVDIGLGAAEATSADASVADESAPFEITPDATAAPASVAAFLRYLEPEDFDSEPDGFDVRHPGHARFVLVDDDGEIARVGSGDYPAYAINVSVWAGVVQPFEMTLGYGNFSLDEQGRLFSSKCENVWGELEGRPDNTYMAIANQLPEVQGFALAETDEGCESNILEPANVFAGTVEIEFEDDGLIVTSEDGERRRFLQIPNELRATVLRDEVVATTIVEATTTTTTLVSE